METQTGSDDTLSPKEVALIELLDDQVRSQRSIAGESGFSLGMTNLLLKRLARKGYIKIVTLNGRTLKYMLTPRGFTEKLKRSYTYVVTFIRQLNEFKEGVRKLAAEKNLDKRNVLVLGRNELADLTQEALRAEGIQADIIGPEALRKKMASLKEGFVLQCLPEPAIEADQEAWEFVQLGELLHPSIRD